MSNDYPGLFARHRIRERREFDYAIHCLAAFGGRVSEVAPKLRDSGGSGDVADILKVVAQLEVFEGQSAELRDVLLAITVGRTPPPLVLNGMAERKPNMFQRAVLWLIRMPWRAKALAAPSRTQDEITADERPR